MNKVSRFLSDVAAGFSVTTWISGPLFEKYALEPALAKATSPQDKKLIASIYQPYRGVAKAGLVGLALTDTYKYFADDLRIKGSKGYKRWALVGDTLVMASILTEVANSTLINRLDKAPRASTEEAQVKSYLNTSKRVSMWLSTALLAASAIQYQERVNSK